MTGDIRAMRERAELAEAECRRLFEALAFYAAEASYIAPAMDSPDESGDYMAPIDADGGARAREVLELSPPSFQWVSNGSI